MKCETPGERNERHVNIGRIDAAHIGSAPNAALFSRTHHYSCTATALSVSPPSKRLRTADENNEPRVAAHTLPHGEPPLRRNGMRAPPRERQRRTTNRSANTIAMINIMINWIIKLKRKSTYVCPCATRAERTAEAATKCGASGTCIYVFRLSPASSSSVFGCFFFSRSNREESAICVSGWPGEREGSTVPSSSSVSYLYIATRCSPSLSRTLSVAPFKSQQNTVKKFITKLTFHFGACFISCSIVPTVTRFLVCLARAIFFLVHFQRNILFYFSLAAAAARLGRSLKQKNRKTRHLFDFIFFTLSAAFDFK